MISLFSLLRSRLLLPVLVTLLLALLAQLLVALLLARVTVGALEKQLAQRLQQDSAALSSALEQASGEVQTGLQALAGKTQGRLAEGLSTRLGEEQQQLRLLLEGGLQQSADDIAQLLAAVAPKAIWDNDVPALTELVRMAQRNSAVVFVVYLDAQGQRLTRPRTIGCRPCWTRARGARPWTRCCRRRPRINPSTSLRPRSVRWGR